MKCDSHYPAFIRAGFLVLAVLVLLSGLATADTVTLHPTGNGYSAQGTPVPAGAGTNWDRVNDQTGNAAAGTPAAFDGNTSYVIMANNAWFDSYTLATSNIPSGSTVTGLDVHAIVRGETTTSCAFQLFYRVNGANTLGTTTTLTSATWTDRPNNFTGLSLAQSAWSTLEIGITAPDANPDVWVTQMYVIVTYTPPAPSDTVTVTQTNVASANVPQGTSNKLLQVLDLSVNNTGNGTATLSSFTVTRLGTAVNADTTSGGIKLWHDVNNSNTWDAGDAQLDGSQTFSGSTVTFTTINFVINNGTPEKLLITANIAAAGTSTEGNTIGSGINAVGDVVLQGTDVVSMSAPLNGNTHSITDSGDTLTVGQTATGGGNITKGTTNNVVMVLNLTANTDTVTLGQLVVTRTGTAVNADTTTGGIKLWHDVNNDNAWDAGDAQLSTSKTFSGGSGTVTFDAISFGTAAGAPERLLITYDIASGATAGHTIGAQIDSAGQVTVNAPDSVALTATPLTGNSFTIAEPVPSVLTVGQTSTGGGNLTKSSTNGVVMVLNLSVDTDSATLTQLVVTRTGTAANGDTTAGGIKLWHDVNNSNTWDAGDAQLDGSQTFSGSTVTFSTINFTINSGTPEKLLITYNISSGATAGNTIGAQIANASQVTVNAPDTVTLTATPLTGDMFTIVEGAQNATTVQTNTAVASTCQQITVTSTFSGDANENSSMEVQYAVSPGTFPGGTVGCSTVTGPSPRQCAIVNTASTPVSASTTYDVWINYTDSDGVSGNSPQTITVATPACGATDNIAPTLLVLSPSRGAVLSGPEKFKVQIFDAGGLKATNPVQWSVDGGVLSSTNVATNTNYSFRCSTANGCWVYEISLDTTTLSNTDHYITIQVTDNATPANVARLDRAFRVNNLAGGSGFLLRRSHGSQLCIDCHNLETHSSQSTSTKYGNWAVECVTCHVPHRTANIFLVRQQIETPRSGKKTVNFHKDDTVGETNPGDVPGNYSFLGARDPSTQQPFDDGVCEICHTRTGHWRNSGPLSPVHNANVRCLKCHTHDAGFRGAGGDCLSCHQSGGAATQSPYNKRAVELDFGKQSHHVGASNLYPTQTTMGGTLNNFDCVVCHAEGLIDGNGEIQANGDYHQNQIIDLKDADEAGIGQALVVYSYNKAAITGAVGTWGTGNATWESQTKDNLDPFCLSCHDSNGAVDSYARGASPGNALNPFADTAISNEVDRLSRTRVTNINSMVTLDATPTDYDGDGSDDPPDGAYARHAIRQNAAGTTGSASRYSAQNIPNSFWNQTVYTWNDTSVMGCADCHTVDGANTTSGNAHGSNSEYLLKDAFGKANEGTFTNYDTGAQTGGYVCWRCHSQGSYSGTNHTGNSGDWQDTTGSTGGTRITAASKGYGTIYGMACINCHGGAPGNVGSVQNPTTPEATIKGYGRIHGTSSIFTNGTAGTRQSYRFTNGGGLRYYDPNGWTGATASCYTLSSGDMWSGCQQHGSNAGSHTKSTAGQRPLSY